MPRYRIVERRCYDVETIIDAENEEAAQSFKGDIVEEIGGPESSWSESSRSEEVDPDYEP